MTWFLIGMAWKSALVSGAALLLLRVLKDSPAAARAALLRFAALLLLALPALSLLLPAIEVAVPQTTVAPAAAPVAAPVAVPMAAPVSLDAPMAAAAVASDTMRLGELLPLLYLAGVVLLALHLGAGLWRLGSWTRSAREPDCPRWSDTFARVRARAGSTRPARLLVSGHVPAPMSWGWRSAAILIDRGSLARPEDAPAVLEHEMAHVDRGDWPALMLVRLAVALFWFNPLVWLLARRFVQCAEEAADARAVGQVEPADYARMLLGYAMQGGAPAVPANAMATSPVAARIEAVLARRLPSGAQRWRLGVAMTGCLAVAAPVAALSIDGGTKVPPAPRAPAAPPAIPAPPPILAAAMQAPAVPEAPEAPEAPYAPEAPEPPLPPEAPIIDRAELDRSVAEAVRGAEEAKRAAEAAVQEAKAQLASIDVEAIRASALRAAAEGMASGAAGLEEGAREMAEKARRVQSDPEYRRRARSEWRHEGRPMSEAEVLEAARKMEQGAVKMREGAEEMRRKAAEMRAQQP